MTSPWHRDAESHQPLRPDGATTADQSSTNEVVLLDGRDSVIGRLRFRACRRCRAGRILDVWVHDEWQGRGLGRELVHCLLVRLPGFSWNTTLQTRTGRHFFMAMAEETSVPFPQGGPLCAHLAGRFTRAWWRAIRPVAALFR